MAVNKTKVYIDGFSYRCKNKKSLVLVNICMSRICTKICVCAYVRAHTCMCICIYIYIYVGTQIDIQTNIYI